MTIESILKELKGKYIVFEVIKYLLTNTRLYLSNRFYVYKVTDEGLEKNKEFEEIVIDNSKLDNQYIRYCINEKELTYLKKIGEFYTPYERSSIAELYDFLMKAHQEDIKKTKRGFYVSKVPFGICILDLDKKTEEHFRQNKIEIKKF